MTVQSFQNSLCFFAPPNSFTKKMLPIEANFSSFLPDLSQVGRVLSLALISHRFEMQRREK